MRKYGRTDRNQTEIVERLRAIGAVVESLASLGDGRPDLLVIFRGEIRVMEVKMPGEELTPDEEAWWAKAHRQGGIKYAIVYSWEDAFRVIGAI